jgi:beta-lactamase class D
MLRVFCVLLLFVCFASCSVNNAKEDDSLKTFFDKYNATGTFGMFNNGSGEFTIYNLSRFRDTGYVPGSTFKIINALIGLETGRVKDSAAVIPWDGVTREVPEWNQDLTMSKAFEYSAVPWFQELARRIGRDTMQRWIDTLGYGSLVSKPVIGNNLDTFWLDNSVKVTADEQLGLVKRLYFGQLPFQPRSQRIVKNMMLREMQPAYSLSYKTGWATTDQNHALGWLVGWIEENKHPYFFVLQVESPDPNFDMMPVRLNLLKDILRKYGFMEGKR